MIEVIGDLPDNTIGVAARGKVTAEDYENIIEPIVDEIFQRHEKARFLYYLGDEFDGFEPGAAWEDTRLGLGHYTGWEKVALVTNRDWLRATFRALGVLMPGAVKTFDIDELDEAKRWVAM